MLYKLLLLFALASVGIDSAAIDKSDLASQIAEIIANRQIPFNGLSSPLIASLLGPRNPPQHFPLPVLIPLNMITDSGFMHRFFCDKDKDKPVVAAVVEEIFKPIGVKPSPVEEVYKPSNHVDHHHYHTDSDHYHETTHHPDTTHVYYTETTHLPHKPETTHRPPYYHETTHETPHYGHYTTTTTATTTTNKPKTTTTTTTHRPVKPLWWSIFTTPKSIALSKTSKESSIAHSEPVPASPKENYDETQIDSGENKSDTTDEREVQHYLYALPSN